MEQMAMVVSAGMPKKKNSLIVEELYFLNFLFDF